MAERIHWNKIDGVTVVRLLESQLLESHALEETYGELLALVETETPDKIALDFSLVQSISAAGLGRLLALKKRLVAQGGELTLRNVGDQVYEAFVVTHLARYFEL